jgi:thiamine-phosphate pyrophosphorylase
VVQESCQAGLRAVQLREKDLSPAELYELAQKVKNIMKPFKSNLFINDRTDIVLAVGADGVHLTTQSLKPTVVRKIVSANLLIGASTHSTDEALAAENDGADFITFGPIYPTPSKAAYGKPLGLEALSRTIDQVTLPVFAIGGVTPSRVCECIDAGAYGVAAISAIMSAPNVFESVTSFRQALGDI